MSQSPMFDMSKATPIQQGEAPTRPMFDMSKAVPIQAPDYAIKPMGIGPLASGLTDEQAKKITSALPSAGGLLGGLLGDGLMSIPAAALGGAAGKALEQLINRALGVPVPATALGAAKQIGASGAEQGAFQAVGEGVGKLAKTAIGPLTESAEGSLTKAFAPASKADKITIQKSMPRLLEERPIALSKSQLLTKVGLKVDEAGENIDKILAQQPKGVKVKLLPSTIQDVAGALQKSADSLTTINQAGKRVAIPSLENPHDLLENMGLFVLDMDPSFDNVRQVRQVLDSSVDANGRWNLTGAEQSTKELQRKTANLLRNALAKTGGPKFQEVNREFSFYKGLQNVLENSIQKRPSSLARTALVAGGSAIGAVNAGIPGAVGGGEAMRLLSRAMDSTAWNTTSASVKLKIADSLAYDHFDQAVPLLMRIIKVANQ